MIEIEIKAKINDSKKAMEDLGKIGATYSHTERQHDIYFNAPDKDYAKTDEALRIRQIPDGDDFKRILTYKGPKINSKSKTRKEVEVEISDVDAMNEILVNLGFKASAIVSKIRRIFNYEDYTITLDKIEELGYYMEIEYVTDDEAKVDEMCDNIMGVFEKLGITGGFERTSYLELLEQVKDVSVKDNEE